jgi:hypothetical protein
MNNRKSNHEIQIMKIKPAIIPQSIMGVLALSALAALSPLYADEVTDWNQNMLTAAFTAKLGPIPTSRVAAMVHSAMFDAVNGTHKRYEPVHVQPAAPRGASARAAAVQAAHDILVDLFPGQQTRLDAQLAASIAQLVDKNDDSPGKAVERGLAWGQYVASQIWAWRSADGFTTVLPPFIGGTDPGEWRPTPPAFAPGINPQVATMETWIIQSHSQFRPGGPPVLDSAQYAADYNEIKVMGSATSATRTADQTQFSELWAGNIIGIWNRAAVQVALTRELSLLQNARMLAQLNLAMADAYISCWDAKYTYVFWRPITAIQLGDTDNNDATLADPNWTPLLVTPAFPEYPSGHSSAGGAAEAALAGWFGDDTSFSITSETLPGVTRSFSSFSEAAEELNDARVFAGIHFRTAVNVGRALGRQVGEYVLENSLRHAKHEYEE